jgi:exo-beta-1,3-glucanase (GH17 family)
MFHFQRRVLVRVGLTQRFLSTSTAAATATATTSTSSTSSSSSSVSKSGKKQRLVVAVGGNALQRRGERLTIENMLKAAADMAPTLAELCKHHELGER